MNLVTLTGTLLETPEAKSTTQNQSVFCVLSLRVESRWTTRDGDEKSSKTELEVTVWGRQAENCAKYLKDGSRVLVEGRLAERPFETQQDGNQTKLEVTARTVQFLPRETDGV